MKIINLTNESMQSPISEMWDGSFYLKCASGLELKASANVKGLSFVLVWFYHGNQKVGKLNICFNNDILIISSITIFLEFQNRGFARETINTFKSLFSVIIADQVRFTAATFWEHMDFIADEKGNYIYSKNYWQTFFITKRIHL